LKTVNTRISTFPSNTGDLLAFSELINNVYTTLWKQAIYHISNIVESEWILYCELSEISTRLHSLWGSFM